MIDDTPLLHTLPVTVVSGLSVDNHLLTADSYGRVHCIQ